MSKRIIVVVLLAVEWGVRPGVIDYHRDERKSQTNSKMFPIRRDVV
jgi:hypothetical protein